MMRRISPLWTVVVLMLLCVVAIGWHYAARGRGNLSAPETGVFLVLRAPQRFFSGVGSWMADVGRVVFRRGSVIRDNQTLQAQVDNLEGENQRLRRYLRENQELRQLLKMPKPWAGRFVPADVVSLNFSDYSQKIFINIGGNQGVMPKDVVFTARGVVGQVLRVNGGVPATSEVLLLTDRNSSISAMTARSMAKGVVQGTGERICKMTYLDYQADVREGDLVLSSGDATVFPRGLVIGRVLRVQKNKTYSTMSAFIDPAVPFDRISAVYVRARTQ